jgi:hypothetical protein
MAFLVVVHGSVCVQVKRIHEYKRQLLNVLQVIHRYNTIKAMRPADREKVSSCVCARVFKCTRANMNVCVSSSSFYSTTP